MKLNDEQNEKVKKYLNEKWPEPQACAVCKEVDWKFSDELFALKEFGSEHPLSKRCELPVIALVCKHCGNTVFFSAISLNLINGGDS
jgi:hypothetical protein